MKKIKAITAIVIGILISLYACTKDDVDILSSFPFEIAESHDDEATINYPESTQIQIEPERIVTDNTYQFKYSLEKGEGYLQYTNKQKKIEQETFYTIDNLELDLEFVGTTVGNTLIEFTVVDNEKLTETIDLEYEVKDNPYQGEVNTTNTNVTVNQTTPITFIIDNVGEDKSVTYKAKIKFQQGSGKIYNTDDDGESIDEIEQGGFFSIEPGSHLYNLELTQTGENTILFETSDSNGQTKENIVTYEVNVVDFTFTGATEKNSLFLGESTNLNFEVAELMDGGDKYECRYEINSGNAKITRQFNNTNEELSPGISYPIDPNAFYWRLESLGDDTIDLNFYVVNGSNTEKSVNIIVEVDNGDFNLNATNSQAFAAVNNNVAVNFAITETGPSKAPYSMVFESSSNGTLELNGSVYSPGEPIPLEDLNVVGSYKGLLEGVHDVTFTVSNSDVIPIVQSDNISITFEDIDFNLSTSGDSSLYNNTTEDFNVFISQEQNDTSIEYNLKCNIADGSIGNGELTTSANGPINLGQSYDIPLGTTSMNFTAKTEGIVLLDVTVTDSNNKSRTSRVTFDVENHDFTFSGAPQQNTIEIGETTNLNFSIDESAISGAAYQMKYEIVSGSGNVKDGSTTQSVNTYYNVNTGNYSWEFEGIELGPVQLLFSARNTITYDSHTQTVNINVSEPPASDFTFTSIPSANNATVDQSVPVNFNITETVGNSDYNMVFTSSGNGTLEYNGISYTQGEPITVTPGSFTGAYNGTSSGTHIIQFTVTNANDVPISHNDDIEITFDNIDFNLSTSGDSSLYVGTSEDFSVHLSQIQNDSNISYLVSYSIASESVGSGEINSNANTSITMGQAYTIDKGTTTMVFNATSVGIVYVDVTVTDSHNQSKTSRVTFDVGSIDFTFSGAPQQNTIETGKTTHLNFTINEAVTSGAAYQMKYEIVSGNGNVKNGATTQSVNTYYNVNIGSYSWDFEATTSSGPVELLFTALNTTTNVTHSQTVTITVNEPPVSDFTFRAIPSANTATVGESVLMHFNITETVGNSNYSMVFTTSSSATFTYNGIEYNQGQSIPVNSGNFTGTYKSSTAAEHDILFTVTNANNVPISHSDDFTITYYLLEFEFSGASQQNTIKTGETTFLNFNISETFVSGNNYEMKYEIISGDGNVKDGGLVRSVNTFFNVNTGSYSWQFEGTDSGTVELLFTAQNTTTNVTRTQTIDIIVTNPPVSQFTFTSIPSANDGTVGQSVPINFNISETVGNSNYSMVFTSTGTGTLEYNGTSYNQGQPISVSPGNFTGAYTGGSSGSHNITFTITNTNDIPISHSDNISISYDSIDFTLSTVGDGSLFLNSQKDFYAIISQENNDNSITYRVRFSITSGSTGNGQIKTAENNTTIPLGSYRDGIVDVGSTAFLFEGTSQGVVNILVEVMDSDNRYKSSTISFTVDNVPFTFDTAAQDGSIEIGESTNIFLNISEPTQSFTNYEVKYQITSSETAQISYNGTSINPNTYRPINTGSTPWTFTGTEEGNIKVMFTVRNKNTLSIRSKTVEIEVNKIPSQFNFTAIPIVNSAKVNDCTDININLSETVGTSTYTMVFTSSESGTVHYNGTTYSQGQPITVSPGNFVVCYTGTNDGLEHDVELTITNSESLSKDKSFNIFIESINDFQFLGSTTSSSVTVNDNVGVNFTLNELVGNSTYSVVFTTNGNGTFVYKGNTYTNGQTIPSFSTGASGGIYYPTSEGNHLIRFVASNSEAPKLSRTYQRLLNVSPSDMEINFSKLSYNQSEGGFLTFDVAEAGVYTIKISPRSNANGYFCSPQSTFCLPGFGAYQLNTDIQVNFNSGANVINFRTNKSTDVIYDISISDHVNTVTETFEIVVNPNILFTAMGYTRYQNSNGVITSCINNSSVYLGGVTSYSTNVRAYVSSSNFAADGTTIVSYDIRYNGVTTNRSFSLTSFNSNGGTYSYKLSYGPTETGTINSRAFNNVLVLGTSRTVTIVDKHLSVSPSNTDTPCGKRVSNAMTSGIFNQNYLNPGNSFQIRIRTSNGKISNWKTMNSTIPTSYPFLFLGNF